MQVCRSEEQLRYGVSGFGRLAEESTGFQIATAELLLMLDVGFLDRWQKLTVNALEV
jgi:hypothetical protein